jgi:predicted DNA-binding protein
MDTETVANSNQKATTLRLPEALHDRVRAMAERNCVSSADLCRMAITAYLWEMEKCSLAE